jgi:hypothetical protein
MRKAVVAAVVSGLLVVGCMSEEEVNQAALDGLMEFMPVWAAAGPFEDGEASARAMRAAILLMLDDVGERRDLLESTADHAASYDADPEAWEENRLVLLEKAQFGPEHIQQARALVLEFDENADDAERAHP